MGAVDRFRYDGKRALVVGGATGMGAAAAELVKALGGAEVVVMDVAPIDLPDVVAVGMDLRDKASIDAALAQAGGFFHAVFAAAGVADGSPGIEKVNFVGHRYLLERLLADGRLPRGAAVCAISSSAGLGWESSFADIAALLDESDFEAAAAWMRDHGKADYTGSKQAMCAYVAREALRFLRQGVRLNAICPGPTDTPLARANAETWLGLGTDFRSDAGITASAPIDQAYPMAFLCSEAAFAIAGVTLVSDLGWFNAGFTGAFPAATPLAEYLLARPAPFRRKA